MTPHPEYVSEYSNRLLLSVYQIIKRCITAPNSWTVQWSEVLTVCYKRGVFHLSPSHHTHPVCALLFLCILLRTNVDDIMWFL